MRVLADANTLELQAVLELKKVYRSELECMPGTKGWKWNIGLVQLGSSWLQILNMEDMLYMAVLLNTRRTHWLGVKVCCRVAD